MSSPLEDVLRRSLPPEVAKRIDDAALEKLSGEIVQRAGAVLPKLASSPDLMAFVGSKISAEIFERGLSSLHVEDLAVAFGCLAGDTAALHRFERELLGPTLRRGDVDPDVAQAVRERLWVARKLADYAGRGPLLAWTRMVVRRQVINHVRDAGPIAPPPSRVGETGLSALMRAVQDPELKALTEDAREAMKEALAWATAELTEHERTLLRMHHLEGIPHGVIGERLELPRSTVAFRLQKARERLLALTRARLEEMVGRASDVDSLIRAVQGSWEVSLSMLRREG